MAVYITDDTKLVIQGATGQIGKELIKENSKFGTAVLAGVAPGRGGGEIGGVPLFNTVFEAADEREVNTSFVLVPGPYMKDACLEAIEAGIETIITITEGVPIQDTLEVIEHASRNNVRFIGPNTLGVVSPDIGSAVLNYHSNSNWYTKGSVGVVARSGSVATDITDLLTQQGIGQSTVLSVGGDPYLGTTPAEVFEAFDSDPETEAIVYCGEIGSRFEREAAEIIPELETPVFASIIGRHAPAGKKMGHAGAISDSDADKVSLLEKAGATVVGSPYSIPEIIEV